MPYVFIFLKCLPYLVALVQAAEAFFLSPKSGPDKKAWVMESVKVIVEGGTAVSTGGQKDTWERVGPLASTAIDLMASIAFPHADDQHIG